MVMGLVQSSNRPNEEEAEANRSPIEEEAEEVCVLCVSKNAYTHIRKHTDLPWLCPGYLDIDSDMLPPP